MSKKKQFYSIMQSDKRCYKSGKTNNLDQHHVMNGPMKKKSEKYGLMVYMNHDEHMWLHGTREGEAYKRHLKAEAQLAFEALYGHEKWMSEFRKNYLPIKEVSNEDSNT